MPEIKHQFSAGKMNLDLDERLVPNGEYREAFNIQVSSSEGANVGVLQNLLKNQIIDDTYNAFEDSLYFTHTCIGSISDEKDNALYWFVRPNWHQIDVGVLMSKATYNETPPATGSWVETNNLWQWKELAPNEHVVKTTISKDMILQYKGGEIRPVFVDQFEVTCGVVDGNHTMPTLISGSLGSFPTPFSELVLQIDEEAWNAISVGFNLVGYTLSVTADGAGPNLISLPFVTVSKKTTDDLGNFFINLKDNPPIDTGTVSYIPFQWNDFIDNINNSGIGPLGLIKALYFQNKKSPLNFRYVRHITGVNIIDDMLFWTDDYNEPKKINIPRSIDGTPVNGQRHTKLADSNITYNMLGDTGRAELSHVTMIKKAPNNPLALELVTGREEGSYTNANVLWHKSYTGVITTGGANPTFSTDDILEIDTNTAVNNFNTVVPNSIIKLDVYRDSAGHDTSSGDYIDFNWMVGDTVVLKEFDETNTDPPALPISDYTIKGQILTLSDPNGYAYSGGSLVVEIEVTSVIGTPPSADANAGNTSGELQYILDKFDEEKNIFEFKYPRFGYRYKYQDGEYSHFSPFTEPAFVPGAFDYHPKKGWNLAMANRIAYIVVKNFKPDAIPEDVIQVDILYKDDSSPMIYVVDTLSYDDKKHINTPNWASSPLGLAPPYNHWDLNAYKITDEQIKYILPENQLLRIYDNVPRKALAQDVTGNRIVYGNYVQNFDLLNITGDKYSPQFIHYIGDYQLAYGNNKKDRSIKSLREYQLGIVFLDEFGRETPVLSNSTGTFKLAKDRSDNNNRLTVGMKFQPPSGLFAKLKYYKFYIKETSGQWYNMAMDRWYDAADGNVWMSFPSSDRDKLTIDDFLILKKAAESNTAVIADPARYKVLAIKNEAPEHIKRSYILMDIRSHAGSVFNAGTLNVPRSGVSTFELNYDEFHATHAKNLHEQFINKSSDDFYVQFEEGGKTSKKYRLSSVTSDAKIDMTTGNITNIGAAKYYVKTENAFGDDVDIILDDPTFPTAVVPTAKIRIFRSKIESKAEFEGRFFVKIFADDVFERHIKASYNPETDTNYIIDTSIELNYMNDIHYKMHEGGQYFGAGQWKDSSNNSYHAGTGFPASELGDSVKTLYYNPSNGTFNSANDHLNTVYGSVSGGGTLGATQNAYSIARRTSQVDATGATVILGLRHFAPFFRKYTSASDISGLPADMVVNDGGFDYTPHYAMSNINPSNYGSAGVWNTNELYKIDYFDPLYKFEYGSSSDDNKWREEYNRYTGIPHKSFDPILWEGNFGSSPYWHPVEAIPWEQHKPSDGPYNVSYSDLLWEDWWRTDGYKKKSDSRARDSEVWYINNGYTAGKEYHTNNKKWSSLYGAQQAHGITISSSAIYLEISLGGLWGEPKVEMDGPPGDPMIDEGFFEIGKLNGNPSYQDAPTVDIVNNLAPGSYCRFKEDPTDTIYVIETVSERNYYNYARFAKDDNGYGTLTAGGNLGPIAASSYNEFGVFDLNAGTILQDYHHAGYATNSQIDVTSNTLLPNQGMQWIYDTNINNWRGDFWGDYWNDSSMAHWPGPIGLYYQSETADNYTMTNTGFTIGAAELSMISWTKNFSHGSQLSCNYSKSWKIRMVNIDDATPNLMPWNPVGGTGTNFGPIVNGSYVDVVVDVTTGNNTLNSGAYTFTTSSILNSTTNAVLTPGMIVTMFDTTSDGTFDVTFDDQITSTTIHQSKLYLQVVDITTVNIPGAVSYIVELGGYMRPLTTQDTYNFAAEGTIRFEQAIMNGYSKNSTHKISANAIQSANFDTGTSNIGGTLDATKYTLQFLKPEEDTALELSTNPAIWETEPKDGPELDIYYEASPRIPITLDHDNANDWIPTRYSNENYITYDLDGGQSISNLNGSYENSVILKNISGPFYTDVEIVHVDGDILTLRCDSNELKTNIIYGATQNLVANPLVTSDPNEATAISIRRPDGIVFRTHVVQHNVSSANTDPSSAATLNFGGVEGGLKPYLIWDSPNFGKDVENSFRIRITKRTYGADYAKSFANIDLNWHNCYSFRNGVESNRIRDNFNTPFISNGVRVSTTLSDYQQERRQYGLIFSGIYNSVSGVNNLNQFIQAEKITKDVNPSYGSIQKLHSRNSDLVTLCEDKVLKILANKDAVYNADGNPQLTANINVLGQTIPFVGEFGISKNPESFASEAYRAYFTDRTRGAVLRLSMDGLTPISDAGMKDWFKDNLKLADNKIIGSYDDEKQEYNVSLTSIDNTNWTSLNDVAGLLSGKICVSYDERVKGWVSFKSFAEMEDGISCSNKYYTFLHGMIYEHHYQGSSYNVFYNNEYKSSVNVLLNDEPSIIKSFKTIGYEGSQAKIPNHISGSNEYDDFYPTLGWYCETMSTNMETGSTVYFSEKESKWFSRIKGENLTTFDTNSFANQGIGDVGTITIYDWVVL